MSDPTVAVLILTWNSRDVVVESVSSVLAQTVACELLVYDNASTDDTLELIAERFPGQVRIVSADRNYGYCGGYNRAIALSRAPIVLLLNPDARLASDAVERLLPAFDDPQVGIVAPLLMRDGSIVDSSGQFLSRSRATIDRGYGKPFDPQRDRAGAVLSACGAAAAYRRAMLDEIGDDGGPFDESFFAYHEDLEIGWRAWRAGWRALHCPAARVIHLRDSGRAGGVAGKTLHKPAPLIAQIVKNRALTSLRHDSLRAVLLDAPWIAARDLLIYGAITLWRPKVWRELWLRRGTLAQAWRRRREDRTRRGRWGPWRSAVPKRGVW